MIEQPSDISVAIAGLFGDFQLAVNFHAPMAGITALFGPSGSGKTSILRCIAGLQHVPGRIAIGGEVWQDSASGVFVPPHRRSIGFVFQDAALFSHLSVRDNLLYGARRTLIHGVLRPYAQIDTDLGTNGIVGVLGIGHLLNRSVGDLSGGERQRVAVGRALLAAPRVLLMDEPLSALDRDTKAEILPYLEALRETAAVPILYVSHDMAEIERLADRLVLVKAGAIVASGALADMQTDPSLPLLGARDAAVTLLGRIAAFDERYGLTTFDVGGGCLIVPGHHGDAGRPLRLRIAASDVSFSLHAAADSTILNRLPAVIQTVEADAEKAQISIVVGLGADGAGDRIAARITAKSRDALALAPGTPVIAQIKSVALLASRGR